MTLALREDYAIIISIDDYGAEIMEYCLRERGETVNNYWEETIEPCIFGEEASNHSVLCGFVR